MDSSQLRDFATRYAAAWCSQDSSQIAAFFSPNGSITIGGGAPAGRSSITEVAQGFMRAFPDLCVIFDELFVRK